MTGSDYLKSDSCGDHVLDRLWSAVRRQQGLAYYPKWLAGFDRRISESGSQSLSGLSAV